MRISPLLCLQFITFSFCLGVDLTFFESKIRPVLSEKCYECHSASGDKIKGGLRLDHIDLILEGGDTGPALVRGNRKIHCCGSNSLPGVRFPDAT